MIKPNDAKGFTLIELVITLGFVSVLILVTLAFYSIFRMNYSELAAKDQAAAYARRAVEHCITSLRRSDQTSLENISSGNSLSVNLPEQGGGFVPALYNVEYNSDLNTYILYFSKNGEKTAIAQDIDGAGGFRVDADGGVISISVSIRHKYDVTKTAAYSVSESYRIRVDAP